MITLTILLIIWSIISFYRINNICKKQNIQFNPFKGSLFDYLGILIGTIISSSFLIWAIINYLP